MDGYRGFCVFADLKVPFPVVVNWTMGGTLG
jgi:hypothetical protein